MPEVAQAAAAQGEVAQAAAAQGEAAQAAAAQGEVAQAAAAEEETAQAAAAEGEAAQAEAAQATAAAESPLVLSVTWDPPPPIPSIFFKASVAAEDSPSAVLSQSSSECDADGTSSSAASQSVGASLTTPRSDLSAFVAV